MPTRHLSFIAAILFAACSGRDATEPATHTATEVARVPIILEGAGRCVRETCTMHFAAAPSGDTATFAQAGCDDGSCPERRARLRPAAQARARAIGAALTTLELDDGYGCPGCVDGPIYVAVVHREDGKKSTHRFDPIDPEGTLPGPLREASQLIDSVSEALERCESTELVEVEPGCAEKKSADDRHPIGRP